MQTSTTLRKGKLSYSPINNAHSIVETVFFIQFSPSFSASTIKKLISVKDELKVQFPNSNEIKRSTFRVDVKETGGQTYANEAESVGIELQSHGADGNLEWILRTSDDTISIHCLDYTRWDDVWRQAEQYFIQAFGHIDGSDSFISSIGLRCIDRFLYEGDPEQSDLRELFKEETPYIVKTAFIHGPLWHCHSGWFENLDTLRCLNQLNVNADYANIEGNKTLSITVDHSTIAIIDQNSNQIRILSPIMKQLHDKNKQLLIGILSTKMAERINLSLPSEE